VHYRSGIERETDRERERSIGEDGEDGEDARVRHKLKDMFVSSQPTLEDRAWIRRGRKVEEGDEHGLLSTIEGFGGSARTRIGASLSIWPLMASLSNPHPIVDFRLHHRGGVQTTTFSTCPPFSRTRIVRWTWMRTIGRGRISWTAHRLCQRRWRRASV
jgi:hypothetical protein